MPTCALCREESTLRNSHIIPEFLYTAMYDAKHRFHQMSVGEKDSRLLQKGFREYLLCDDCEQRFSKWERYARAVLSGDVALDYKSKGGTTWINGIDYGGFKLFQLSILWRAGVSKQEFFENVKLGPHEQRIRQMLLHGDAGSPAMYGCLVSGARLEGRPADVIVQPTKTRVADAAGFRFVFGGFLWTYVVASHAIRGPLSQAFLQRNGRMAFMVSDLEHTPFFRDLLRRLSK